MSGIVWEGGLVVWREERLLEGFSVGESRIGRSILDYWWPWSVGNSVQGLV